MACCGAAEVGANGNAGGVLVQVALGLAVFISDALVVCRDVRRSGGPFRMQAALAQAHQRHEQCPPPGRLGHACQPRQDLRRGHLNLSSRGAAAACPIESLKRL